MRLVVHPAVVATWRVYADDDRLRKIAHPTGVLGYCPLCSLAGMDEGPPRPVAGEPWIWLSATTVSSDGAQLASAVANTTDATIPYGVLGIFEHWSDGRWARAGSWVTSLDHWGGFPEIAPDGRQVVVPAIGLHAPGNGLGPVEYFSLPPLAEG
jgi:hypothetical protein